MNDFEVQELFDQVQRLEEQVQLIVEALIGDDSKPYSDKKSKAKK